MLRETKLPTEQAFLAQAIRSLAVQARRTLAHPINEREVGDLLRSIRFLEQDSRFQSSTDLSRWLVSLRAQVEKHVATAA